MLQSLSFFHFQHLFSKAQQICFSTQYLIKFAKDKKEKYIFWSLVVLTVASFLTSIFFQYFVIEILFSILFINFLLIYSLYKELRKRINPETTLIKIKDDAIDWLEYVSKELKKRARIENKIFNMKMKSKIFH